MPLLAVGVVAAQGNKEAAPASGAQREAKLISEPQTPEGAQDLRRAHLRLLRETTLSRAVENIKGMDEAALRISVRNELLTHLGDGREPAGGDAALATGPGATATRRSVC